MVKAAHLTTQIASHHLNLTQNPRNHQTIKHRHQARIKTPILTIIRIPKANKVKALKPTALPEITPL